VDTVEVVEQEGDVEAMDALLRTMYGATVPTDVLVLLRASHLADRFLVSKPVAQLLASRLADVPDDAITDDVLALAFDERSASLASPLPLELMDKCRVYLRTAFRNVPDVVTQPALLARFCSLPHAAVVAWSETDSLQVNSENDVVYLLSAWVEAQETAGCPCSAEQLKKLVYSVRLAECGPSYQHCVVPTLDWFKSGLKHLGAFAISRDLKKAGVQHSGTSDVPDAWLAAKPREKLATCEVVMEFQVNAEKLEALDVAGTKFIFLDYVFVSGFWMKACLQSFENKTTPGEITLGCYAYVDCAKMAKVVPWPEAAAVAFSCSMEVGKAAKIGPSTFIVEGRTARGYSNILDASAASMTALVAPHLEGGLLKGKVTFSSVDLLHCLE
jgi:hypothetical protein